MTISLSGCPSGVLGNNKSGDDNKPNDNNTTQEFTVTFDANDGAFADTTTNKTVKVKKGEALKNFPEAPTKNKATFLGWFTKAENGEKWKLAKAINENITLYAHWQKNISNTLWVTFDANGGNFTDNTTSIRKFVKEGDTVERPKDNPTQKGYEFLHWSVEKNGTTAYDFSKKINKDCTLYAVWNLTNLKEVKIEIEELKNSEDEIFLFIIRNKLVLDIKSIEILKENPAIKNIVDNWDKSKPQISLQNIKINTFHKEENSTTNKIEYIGYPITPDFMRNTSMFVFKKLNNLANNGTIIPVRFKSYRDNDIKDYFDVIEFAKLKFSDSLELTSDSKIYLNGEREKKVVGNEDRTPYATVNELLTLITNTSLKNSIVEVNAIIRGNVKELLPYLVDNNKLEGVKFPNAKKIPCSGIYWAGYNGDNEDAKNTVEQSILPIKQLQELHKHTIDKTAYIRNAIIENLNCKENNFDLENTHFTYDKLGNIEFRGSNTDLTDIAFDISNHKGTAIFNGKLPINMSGDFQHLILQNAEVQITTDNHEYIPKEKRKYIPYIKESLTIKGSLIGAERIFYGWTAEEIKNFKHNKIIPAIYT